MSFQSLGFLGFLAAALAVCLPAGRRSPRAGAAKPAYSGTQVGWGVNQTTSLLKSAFIIAGPLKITIANP